MWDAKGLYFIKYFRIFSSMFRPISDLCTFKNEDFRNYYNPIYPDELELKKKYDDPCKVLLLKLSIEYQDKIYN